MRTYVLILTLALPFTAQAQCGDYAKITKDLRKKHGESLVFRGFSPGKVVETWASSGTESWSVLQSFIVIMPGNVAVPCTKIVASGKGWSGQAEAFFGLPGAI